MGDGMVGFGGTGDVNTAAPSRIGKIIFCNHYLLELLSKPNMLFNLISVEADDLSNMDCIVLVFLLLALNAEVHSELNLLFVRQLLHSLVFTHADLGCIVPKGCSSDH